VDGGLDEPRLDHFDSKLGLYLLVRQEMERRVVDRMTGAAASVGSGRAAATSLPSTRRGRRHRSSGERAGQTGR
jgi:hypothetical protein